MDKESIKKYMADAFSSKERNAFEQFMEEDAFLKESMDGWQLAQQHGIDMHKIELDLTQLIEKKVSAALYNQPLFRWAVAACIAGILSISGYQFFFISKQSDEQAIYAAYFKPLTHPDAAVRGENTPTIETQAVQAYEQEDYFEAVKYYEKLVSNNPANIKNNLFLGISFLATNQPKKAIAVFKPMLEAEEFHFDIQWYLALAYLKNKQLPEAELILQNLSTSENYYRQDAAAILSELNDKAP